jgi:hypothetical protein
MSDRPFTLQVDKSDDVIDLPTSDPRTVRPEVTLLVEVAIYS